MGVMMISPSSSLHRRGSRVRATVGIPRATPGFFGGILASTGQPLTRAPEGGRHVESPEGYGIEVLYELPREVWERDIDAAQNYAERLLTEGEEAMIDQTENAVFGRA